MKTTWASEIQCARLALLSAQRQDSGWVLLEPPQDAEIRSLSSPPGGGLWLIIGENVWTRDAAGSWRTVELPHDADDKACAPRSLWARTNDDIFVVADCATPQGQPTSVLFRTTRGG